MANSRVNALQNMRIHQEKAQKLFEIKESQLESQLEELTVENHVEDTNFVEGQLVIFISREGPFVAEVMSSKDASMFPDCRTQVNCMLDILHAILFHCKFNR